MKHIHFSRWWVGEEGKSREVGYVNIFNNKYNNDSLVGQHTLLNKEHRNDKRMKCGENEMVRG